MVGVCGVGSLRRKGRKTAGVCGGCGERNDGGSVLPGAHVGELLAADDAAAHREPDVLRELLSVLAQVLRCVCASRKSVS